MNAFENALYSRLTGAGALLVLLATGPGGSASVYNELAPRDADLDYVVFSLNAGGPTNRSPRRAESLVYLVKGVSTGAKAAGAIDDQIDVALHDQVLDSFLSQGVLQTNYWLMRESRVRYVETTQAGKLIYHAGGLYRARLGT